MRRPVPRRSRRTAGVVASLASAALAVVGLQLPTAAPAAAAPSHRPDVVRQCADAKPGEFSCFALRRTDVPAMAGVQPHATTPDGFGATDLQSAYALPPDGGSDGGPGVDPGVVTVPVSPVAPLAGVTVPCNGRTVTVVVTGVRVSPGSTWPLIDAGRPAMLALMPFATLLVLAVTVVALPSADPAGYHTVV